jgi:hypothetical protein
MTSKEYRNDKQSGRADVISAWLLVLLALVAMNTVLTAASMPW